MAGLPLPPVPYTKPFSQIVSDFAAAAQAQSKTPLDFNVGSVFLALAEGNAGVADWLQKCFLFALLVERLQTAQGQWVDTFCADYMPPVAGTNSPRLPAQPATGLVTFSRFNPQAQAIIPVGALVATFDGSQVYSVTADTTNNAYSATVISGGGFIIPAGTASINVLVKAINPGTAANARANTITLLQSSVVGVDSVTNAVAFGTGLDMETDDQLKARFKLYILSLRAGTPGAIGYSITSLQQGLQYSIHENIDPNRATDYGALTIYIDDGSGNPPAATVQLAANAVNGVRAAGVRPQVLGATTLTVNVNMTISVASGYDTNLTIAAVQNAVSAYVDNLGLEATLPFSMLEHTAYNASPGVTNVTNTSAQISPLGGMSTADITPPMGQTIKIGLITVQA